MNRNNKKSNEPRNHSSGGESPPQILSMSRDGLQEFDGYLLIEELARGGQATVYKAVHKATKAKVALKVLYYGPLFSDKARWQFEREIDLVAHLDHPYIVKVHNSGAFEGGFYFAMDYIHGKLLDEYVESNELSLRETILLFHKVCEAITHAHQRGVIHRDLKPSNILIDERGDPHVLDFGLAKAAGTASSAEDPGGMPSMTGEIKGTLAYMSPEQARGRPDLVDVRTDVYSLGVVFYRILNGQFPYDVSGGTVQTLRNIESAEPTRPRDITARFNSELEAILLKSLAKPPNDRYQSAADLRDEIQRWLAGLPIMAKSVSSVYLIRKLVAKHAYVSLVILLLLVIILGFSTTYGHLYRAVQRKNIELQKAMIRSQEEHRQNLSLARQVMFSYVLDLWHSKNIAQAKAVSKAGFGPGSREDKARIFLLDTRPIVEKSDAFHEALMNMQEPGFADFVIAEHCLRDGDIQQAKVNYESFLMVSPAAEDQMFRMRANLKLNDLLSSGEPNADNSGNGDLP